MMVAVTFQPPPALIQALVASFDRRRAQYDLARLCDTEFAGRRIGTDGHDRAYAWLLHAMRDLGLAITPYGFALDVPVLDLYAPPALATLDESGGVLRAFAHRREFAEHPHSADRLDAVVGLASIWQDGADLRGAWGLLDVVPQDEAFAAVAEQAARQGAIGLLTPQHPGTDGYLVKRVVARAPLALPVVAVRADILPSLEGQHVCTVLPLRRTHTGGWHVLGRIDGTDAALAHTPLLVGAHYDGVGDDPGGLRIPGAADNAAGVAVVLEVARVLSRHPTRPRRPIIVAAFDGEEVNALGSRAYAHDLKRQGLMPLVINLDGAARFNDAVWVEPGGPADVLVDALDRAGQWLEIPLLLGPVGSDNRRYAEVGFPTTGIALGGASAHTPADVPEQVDATAMEMAGRLLLATIGQLAF